MAKNEVIWFDADVFDDALAAATDETIKVVRQAIFSTMRRVRGQAVTMLSSEIRKKWNIAKKNLDEKIMVKIGNRASGYESFEMTIKGTALSLSYFGAKQFAGTSVKTRTKGYTRKRASKFQGVEVQVLKGKNKKVYLTNAFMQTAQSGHVMVLRREGKDRYPIDMKAVISPASMFENDKTYDDFTDRIMEVLEERFAHELQWRLSQAGLL